MGAYFSAFERIWLRALVRRLTGKRSSPSWPSQEALAELSHWGGRNLAARPGTPGLPDLALLSPAPPAGTGIATFAAAFFQGGPWNLDFYAPGAPAELQRFQDTAPGARVLPVPLFGELRSLASYHAIMLQIGNSPHHGATFEAWIRAANQSVTRRLVYLHEAQLVRLWASRFEADPWGLRRWYRDSYPDRRFSLTDLFQPQGVNSRIPRGVRQLLQRAEPDVLLVNNAASEALVRQDLEGWTGPMPEIRRLFHPIPARRFPAAGERKSKGLRIGHFGSLGQGKGFRPMIEALRFLRTTTPATLVLAGFGVARFARRHGLDGLSWVEIHDSPSDQGLLELMDSVDVAIQLRLVSEGESSGVVAQLLGLGKPVVATASGAFSEMGDAIASVPPAAEGPDVAAALTRILADPPQAAIEALARNQGLDAFRQAILGAIRSPVEAEPGA